MRPATSLLRISVDSCVNAIRYVPGQRLYLAAERPTALASLVVDNTDLENPTIVRAA